jgi:hypothetical protein
MAPPDVVKRAFRTSIGETGGLPEITQQGLGPDLIMQIVSGDTLIRTLEGTIGIPRGNEKPPQLEDFLHGMEARSVWRGPKGV